MDDNQSISFIEDINSSNNSITNIQNENINPINSVQDNKQNDLPITEQFEDYIRKLPSWDINPPLEINRGEQ